MTVKITGLNKLINRLEKTVTSPEKADKVLYRLAEIGQNELKEAYRLSENDYNLKDKVEEPITPKITTSIDRITNGVELSAEGEELLFFEFGAGVSKNSPRSWENVLNIQVPEEILPIGAYGMGLGLLPSWVYRKDGVPYKTTGIAARAGFPRAINKMVENVDIVIKEVMNE